MRMNTTLLDWIMFNVYPAVNIINYYGSQESRTAKDDILQSWYRLTKHMREIQIRGEACLLIGDLNRAVGAGKWGVKGNKEHVSYGGQLVRDLPETEDYTLLNSLDMVEGGPWTWISRANANIKSCLDQGIVSKNLLPFVQRVVVDEKQEFTPFRVVKRKAGITSCFSDHFSFKVILGGMPSTKQLKKIKETVWNLNKLGGWDEYKNKTDEVSNQVIEIVDDENYTIDEVMKRVQKVEDKVKFAAFGKTRKRLYQRRVKKEELDNRKFSCGLESCQTCQKEVDKNFAVLKKQCERMEKEIIKVKESGQGRVGQIFKMKEVVGGPKKASMDPHAIEDPQTKELLVANSDIKRATLEYCANNLRNKEPDPEAKEIVELKRALMEERMKNNSDEALDISKEDYDTVLTKFKTKQTKSYDFLIKAGENYQEAIYKLCVRMIQNKEFPIMFRKTYMIWKQKGPQEILQNNRFIHLKEHYLPRTVEALVVNKMKDDILGKSTIYQVGGQPGHGTDEHIFTIKSMIGLLESKNLGMIFTLVDLISFFDRESIFDVMATLHEVGVNSMVHVKSEY